MAQESLFITLALEQIRRFTSPHLPREQADNEQQLFMSRLSQDDEKQILRQYLNLEDNVFNSLSPQVHSWFLQRLLIDPSILFATERIPRLGSLYLRYPNGLVRHKIVEVLYALDQRSTRPDTSPTYLSEIIKHIRMQESGQPSSLLEELTNILLDVSLQTKLKDIHSSNKQAKAQSKESENRFSSLEQLVEESEEEVIEELDSDNSEENQKTIQPQLKTRLKNRFEKFDTDSLGALLDDDKNKELQDIVNQILLERLPRNPKRPDPGELRGLKGLDYTDL